MQTHTHASEYICERHSRHGVKRSTRFSSGRLAARRRLKLSDPWRAHYHTRSPTPTFIISHSPTRRTRARTAPLVQEVTDQVPISTNFSLWTRHQRQAVRWGACAPVPTQLSARKSPRPLTWTAHHLHSARAVARQRRRRARPPPLRQYGAE